MKLPNQDYSGPGIVLDDLTRKQLIALIKDLPDFVIDIDLEGKNKRQLLDHFFPEGRDYSPSSPKDTE